MATLRVDGRRAHAEAAASTSSGPSLTIFSPAGVVVDAAALRRAAQRLRAVGFDARLDDDALARRQRFAGDDDRRLAALHRIADAAPSVAMASRGGYGLTRLLDVIDWRRLARSVARGTRWVGYSDLTALQLALWAHRDAPTWAGPLAADDFGRVDADGGVDEVTRDCFAEAMDGSLEAVGFRTDAGFDGLDLRGPLWGGNLTVLCSLLGTRHFPPPARLRGGVLFVEEVNEHPYRVERMLLQLAQSGVLGTQKALLVGAISGFRASPLDRGYGVASMLARVRAGTRTPVLTGLPVGRRVHLMVDRRQAYVAWAHAHG